MTRAKIKLVDNADGTPAWAVLAALGRKILDGGELSSLERKLAGTYLMMQEVKTRDLARYARHLMNKNSSTRRKAAIASAMQALIGHALDRKGTRAIEKSFERQTRRSVAKIGRKGIP